MASPTPPQQQQQPPPNPPTRRSTPQIHTQHALPPRHTYLLLTSPSPSSLPFSPNNQALPSTTTTTTSSSPIPQHTTNPPPPPPPTPLEQPLDETTARLRLSRLLARSLGDHGAAIPLDILAVKGCDVYLRVPVEDASGVMGAVGGGDGQRDGGADAGFVVKTRSERLSTLDGAGNGQDLFAMTGW